MKIHTFENIDEQNDKIEVTNTAPNNGGIGGIFNFLKSNPKLISTLSKTILPIINGNKKENQKETQDNIQDAQYEPAKENDAQTTNNFPSENSQISLGNLFGSNTNNNIATQNNTQNMESELQTLNKIHERKKVENRMEQHRLLINYLKTKKQ